MWSVALAAPTGKAARRISEVTGYSAGTIHKLLGAKSDGRGGWTFDFNEKQTLSYARIIVDESSMMDVQLTEALLRAVNPNSSLFFIGDADQLPSVGPGQVLADLIESGVVPTIRLTHIHRAAMESWVCRNAPLIINGDIDILTKCDDFRFYEIEDAEQAAKVVVDLVVNKMPAKGISNVQVLAPQNAGPIGIETLNNALQYKLNSVKTVHGVEEPVWRIRAPHGAAYYLHAGDLVLATENDYDKFIFNGEIGRITQIHQARDRDGRSRWVMEIDFDGRLVEFDRKEARKLRLAYAITIHKAQGSEWDWVVVICHSSNEYMWSRQLLYTAVTRAKKGVVLIGDKAGISAALNNDAPRQRTTTLAERLRA